MSIEAMKQALEALEQWTTPHWAGTGVDKANAAHAALRTAIAEAESRATEQAEFDAAHESLEKQAGIHVSQQSAPVQEPVAYDKTELNCFAQDLYDQKMREGKRGHYESMFHVIHQCVKKVAPPPAAQRQWVGLTAEDYPDADNQYCCVNADFIEGARWAAATLREKNGGQHG